VLAARLIKVTGNSSVGNVISNHGGICLHLVTVGFENCHLASFFLEFLNVSQDFSTKNELLCFVNLLLHDLSKALIKSLLKLCPVIKGHLAC